MSLPGLSQSLNGVQGFFIQIYLHELRGAQLAIDWDPREVNVYYRSHIVMRQRIRAHHLNPNFKNMTLYEQIIEHVNNGARFTIDLEERTVRINGKTFFTEQDYKSGCLLNPLYTQEIAGQNLEELYAQYYRSVPSHRSAYHRSYFKALPEEKLTNEDMLYGKPREVAQCELELFFLFCIVDHRFSWQPDWGTWFWQSTKYPSFVILRSWVEPRK